MVLNLNQVFVKISQRVSKFLSRHNFQTKIFQGEYFHKIVNGLMVLVLCTLPDGALYFYKFHENISKGFQVIEQTRFPY